MLGLGFFLEDIHGGSEPFVVKADKGIVQHHGGVRGKLLRHRKTQSIYVKG